MVLEPQILRHLLDRENYLKYRNYVPELPPEAEAVLHAIDDVHIRDLATPTVEDVANLVFARGLGKANPEIVKTILERMKTSQGDATVSELFQSIKNRAICQKIAVQAVNYTEGRGSLDKILALANELKFEVDEKDDIVTDDLNQLLDWSVNKPGLRWRLNCLNKSLGSLRKGNFGFLFARSNVGKTSFIASEVTYMTENLPEDAGPVLWFNNEEAGYVVRIRQYQALLGARLEHLKSKPQKAKEVFQKKTKGKLMLIDDATISHMKITALAEKYKPSLIVIDQIDKVSGFSADRKDLELGTIYQWAREMSKRFCPVIGVCQADGTAEGVRYLNMGHVSNSKTSKQAEADWIIGIGKDNAVGYENIRFLSVIKNKLLGDEDTDPALRHATFEVRLLSDIARYEDL